MRRALTLLSRTRLTHTVEALSQYRDGHEEYANNSSRFGGAVVVGGTVLAAYALFESKRYKVYAEAKKEVHDLTPPQRPDLPLLRMDEVKKHAKGAKRVWTTYKDGIYDITDFVVAHPGGDKILLAAGDAVEPYWALYAQHLTKEVMEIMESLRVGTLHPDDLKVKQEAQKRSGSADDPFANDPIRHPALIANSERPYNAEIPPSLLLDKFVTPNALFFVRNHLPVPKTDPATHKLTVDVDEEAPAELRRRIKPVSLSVAELKNNYKEHSVNATIQCAGNRRTAMSKYRTVKGLSWNFTAISNAKWTGVRLADVLMAAGIRPDDDTIQHIHLWGADRDPTGSYYGASITKAKAFHPDTIIAYSMNDEPIPPDHGQPLRLVAPGKSLVSFAQSVHSS